MNITQIEKVVETLVDSFNKDTFIYDFLLAYNIPKATITLLRKGNSNLSKIDSQIILKKKIFFQEVDHSDLHTVIDALQQDKSTYRHSPRFIIVTDHHTLLALDTKTNESLDISILGLAKRFDFFLPLAGMEKSKDRQENPADRKAAEKMARIYDEIVKDNHIKEKDELHSLNIFLSRLLFCFFAEDTNIFPQNIFTKSIESHTQADGSDMQEYLQRLFERLNNKDATSYPAYLQEFPYVNGGLFGNEYTPPEISAKARKMILECGDQDWKDINPDIFGSMMQTVAHPDQRGDSGMHYTSVPNIMKVIEPLFLDDLKEEFEKNKDNRNKLTKLLGRISQIKFFDPACGSGNFLIITYKELSRLQIEILRELGSVAYPQISLSQFYGIELDDFAHEIAMLSLHLAKHQVNKWREKEGIPAEPILPLRDSGNIKRGNATRLDWEEVCPKEEGDEIYVMGNPQYLGFSQQKPDQKRDMDKVFKQIKNYKKLDYISCWFYLGSRYIEKINAKLAFVSTNSICQGEQVALLWPHILEKNLEIAFAVNSFKWINNAKGNAGVTVSVIGLRNTSNEAKYLFTNGHQKIVKNINTYLTEGTSSYIKKRKNPISKQFPVMMLGDMAKDGSNLILSKEEKEELVLEYPNSKIFLRRFIGGIDFLRGIERWCLWIKEKDYFDSKKIDPIKKRFEKVSQSRLQSKKEATQKFSNRPYRFIEVRKKEVESIMIPTTSSESRKYIPIGFIDSKDIVTAPNQVIYDPEPWIFGVVSSRMHMTWIRAVCGSLETRIRYSSALGYNTFPIPDITENQKENITEHVYNVIEERAKHPEKTIAQMYDPDKMPDGLRQAHAYLDEVIERCYRSAPFRSDEERLEYLFRLYESMIEEERNNINVK